MEFLVDHFRAVYDFDSWDASFPPSNAVAATARAPFSLYIASGDPLRRIARNISPAHDDGAYYTLLDTVEQGGRLFRIRTTPYTTLQGAKEGFLRSLVASVSYVRQPADSELGVCFAHPSGSMAFLRDHTAVHVAPLGLLPPFSAQQTSPDGVRELCLFVARQLSAFQTSAIPL